MKRELLEGLNSEQQKVISSIGGHQLVISSAGSGKTLTLVRSVASLIDSGVSPDRILLLTFTRKAANEMKERAVNLIDERANDIECGTFHSYGLKLLRTFYSKVGFSKDINILDSKDDKTLLELLAKENKVFDIPLISVLNAFSLHINTGKPVRALVASITSLPTYKIGSVEKLFDTYMEYKRKNNLMNFDDILLYTLKLLQIPEVLKHQAMKYKYILVDEYQDTNFIQVQILRQLESTHHNILGVGDDFQCWEEDGNVLCKDGLVKTIKEVNIGDKLQCIVGGKITFSMVTDISDGKRAEVVMITMKSSGYRMYVTPSHRCFVYREDFDSDFSPINTKSPVSITFNQNVYRTRSITPPHILTRIVYNEEEGYAVRKGYTNYREALESAKRGMRGTGADFIVEKFRFVEEGKSEEIMLIAVPTYLVVPGMKMVIVRDGKLELDTVEFVDFLPNKGIVYDIEVEEAGNLIVDGVVSHNSIYKFRGADYKNILAFPNTFNDCHIIKLEQNYRSTKAILDLANAVCTSFKHKFDKEMFTDSGVQGTTPLYYRVTSEEEQAQYVAEQIKLFISEKGYFPHDCAVLYRANSSADLIASQLDFLGIPHKKEGDKSLFDKAHIRDLVAFMKMVYYPTDVVSWNRVLMLHKGIGAATVNKITEEGINNEKGFNALDEIKLSPKQAHTLESLFEFLKEMKKTKGPSATFKYIYTYYRSLMSNKYDRLESRSIDINNLIDLASNYKFCRQFLTEMTLNPDTEKEFNGVVLSTIHGVKGLEFKNVWLVNVNNKKFPSSYFCKTQEDLEEERRLFYVAITRAKEYFCIVNPMSENEIDQYVNLGRIEDSDESIFMIENPAVLNHMVTKYSPLLRMSHTNRKIYNEYM